MAMIKYTMPGLRARPYQMPWRYPETQRELHHAYRWPRSISEWHVLEDYRSTAWDEIHTGGR